MLVNHGNLEGLKDKSSEYLTMGICWDLDPWRFTQWNRFLQPPSASLVEIYQKWVVYSIHNWALVSG